MGKTKDNPRRDSMKRMSFLGQVSTIRACDVFLSVTCAGIPHNIVTSKQGGSISAFPRSEKDCGTYYNISVSSHSHLQRWFLMSLVPLGIPPSRGVPVAAVVVLSFLVYLAECASNVRYLQWDGLMFCVSTRHHSQRGAKHTSLYAACSVIFSSDME